MHFENIKANGKLSTISLFEFLNIPEVIFNDIEFSLPQFCFMVFVFWNYKLWLARTRQKMWKLDKDIYPNISLFSFSIVKSAWMKGPGGLG